MPSIDTSSQFIEVFEYLKMMHSSTKLDGLVLTGLLMSATGDRVGIHSNAEENTDEYGLWYIINNGSSHFSSTSELGRLEGSALWV